MGKRTPEEKKAYHKAWYQENRVQEAARARQRQHELRETIATFKTARGCDRCGYAKSPRALHFHHRDPSSKEYNIARMIATRAAMSKIFAEIEKCDLLCANCHAELHDDTLE